MPTRNVTLLEDFLLDRTPTQNASAEHNWAGKMKSLNNNVGRFSRVANLELESANDLKKNFLVMFVLVIFSCN